MTKFKESANSERHWLDWCRLCANDDACINVRKKDVYMRIISKCFDIEIGFEEPQLGGLLCNECYALIGELLNFAENVNKVQPIFELLRHCEPNEYVDVYALRQQYGLHNRGSEHSYKLEPEMLSSREGSLEPETDLYFQEDHCDNQHDLAISPVPIKRKRGRPKGSKKRSAESAATNGKQKIDREPSKEDLSSDLEMNEETFEDALVQNHIWLEDCQPEDNKTPNSTVKRKRGRPKLAVKNEVLDEWEEVSKQSPNDQRNSTDDPSESKVFNEEEVSVEHQELFNPDETGHSLMKRKRGRPRKEKTPMSTSTPDLTAENLSKCKNVALARLLLASPDREIDAKMQTNDNRLRRNSVTCGTCHKKLSSEVGLKYHVERVHMKKKPFVCDVCGKRVRTVSELKEHMLVHTEDRPFVCPLCNAAFKNRKRLNIHNQTHGEPSYECEICGKKLQTRAIWNKHKSVHTNERRFKCTICGTATKNSTALKIHLLSHTGLRPYTCKYCNKDFASGANCRDHKIRKHPVEYAQDDDKSCRIQSVPTLDELRALAAGMEKGERLRKLKTTQIK